MSLPFLNPRKIAASVIAKQTKSGSLAPAEEAEGPAEASIQRAEAMLSAIAAKDATALATAMDMGNDSGDDNE